MSMEAPRSGRTEERQIEDERSIGDSYIRLSEGELYPQEDHSASETAELAGRHAARLKAVEERLGIKRTEDEPDRSAEATENNPYVEKIRLLKATSEHSVERLLNIVGTLKGHPELSEPGSAIRRAIDSKIAELRDAPALVDRKREFWKKWKNISASVAVGSAAIGIGAGVYAVENSLNVPYFSQMFGSDVDVPMVVGLLGSALAGGSAGIAKFLELLAGNKSATLQQRIAEYGL